MIRRLVLGAVTSMLALLGAVAPALAQTNAQNWPQRAVKFIVPFGAGAGADIGARLFADRLSQTWKQPVIVENRPGADGLVAISAFINANDDHTLLFAASGSFTVHRFQYAKLPYKDDDLVPLAQVSNTIIVVSVPASSDVKSLADFVKVARANPGKLDAALVPGITEYAFRSWLKQDGMSMTSVPYRNIVQAVPDLAEGRVQIMMSSLAIVQPQVQAGKVRILCVTGRQPVSQLPGIPTSEQAGFPHLELEGLAGLFGPRKMTEPLRERIAADVRAATADGVIGERLGSSGQVINIGGPKEFAASIQRQRDQVAEIAKLLDLKQLTH